MSRRRLSDRSASAGSLPALRLPPLAFAFPAADIASASPVPSLSLSLSLSAAVVCVGEEGGVLRWDNGGRGFGLWAFCFLLDPLSLKIILDIFDLKACLPENNHDRKSEETNIKYWDFILDLRTRGNSS